MPGPVFNDKIVSEEHGKDQVHHGGGSIPTSGKTGRSKALLLDKVCGGFAMHSVVESCDVLHDYVKRMGNSVRKEGIENNPKVTLG